MKSYKLANGLRMPAIGLGTWQLIGATCIAAVRRALELGYTHIDTALMYGNHREIGEAIQGFDRGNLFITSKIAGALRYQDVISGCQWTLRELNTEYLDQFLVHWPERSIPVAETLRGFKKLYDDNLIRSVGVSNFMIPRLQEALEAAAVPIVVNQVEFHPYLYQKTLLDFCRKNNVQVVAYSPLGRGELMQDHYVNAIAEKHGRAPAQVVLRWMLDKKIVVIPKATSERHLRENLDVDFHLSAAETEILDRLPERNGIAPQRYVLPDFADFHLHAP